MKKIFGLIVLATIFIVGSAAAYGSPPTCEKAQTESITATADVTIIERLKQVSDQAAEKVLAEHAGRIAEIIDTSDTPTFGGGEGVLRAKYG